MGSLVADDWTFRAVEVSKSYNGETPANDRISLEVHPGEVYGLLGPNGAGKSTLVKQVIGLLKPDSGSITLGPFDLVEDPDAARQLCSYLPQAQMPIDSFKIREAVHVTGYVRGNSGARTRQALWLRPFAGVQVDRSFVWVYRAARTRNGEARDGLSPPDGGQGRHGYAAHFPGFRAATRLLRRRRR